jgi:hypothetical protein
MDRIENIKNHFEEEAEGFDKTTPNYGGKSICP